MRRWDIHSKLKYYGEAWEVGTGAVDGPTDEKPQSQRKGKPVCPPTSPGLPVWTGQFMKYTKHPRLHAEPFQDTEARAGPMAQQLRARALLAND